MELTHAVHSKELGHDAATMVDGSRWGVACVTGAVPDIRVDTLSVNEHLGIQHFMNHFEAHVRATAAYEPDLAEALIGSELLVMYEEDQPSYAPSLVDVYIPDLMSARRYTVAEAQALQARLHRWAGIYVALVNPGVLRVQNGRAGRLMDA